ncbi:MAG TPA: AAA family ATPase [Ktedonobacteraceae bacterium]|nr:AAA family ATPase [Ktedonobacteraceae bacterium]
MQQNTTLSWSFPFCPTPPHWQLDWQAIERQFSWIRAMADIEQDPFYHAEGDVFIHTHMVAEELVRLNAWRTLPQQERMLVFAAALLHDVAKPQCTRVEEDGHIHSRGHARKGEHIARRLLWSGDELPGPLPFATREQIARMVRFHGLPLQFLDKSQPERAVIAASMSARMDYVALLAEADVRGRICADQPELLERIELFRAFCTELGCYDRPRPFASPHSRFVYFRNEHAYPDYVAYDDTTFEVVLMAGLPGAGKDAWIAQHLSDWPVISLDEIRKRLRISPEEKQGQVIQAAKEQARAYMRRQQPFVWNATNVTRILREQLVDFFVSYGARVRIVYLDAPLAVLQHRNKNRSASVPEAVINKLLDKLDVPDLTEAQSVVWESV